jgi:uncharacterized iron-regulated membrane protein
MRWLLLLHRYLGIAVGALMVMWCASGVVMMYVGYPALDANLRVRNLAPIDWSGCCKISEAQLTDSSSIDHAQIEMMAGHPVLGAGRQFRPIDLITGSALDRISAGQAATVANGFVKETSPAPLPFTLIDYDQWTVSDEFDADRPLYRFALRDKLQTELYVSSKTGRAVQITTAGGRFWNWLGAVPHWLYFAELRRDASLWSAAVIYTSLLGCFLAGIGLYIGVRQMIAQPPGRGSPYRGFNLWHHLAGLVFGLFALTWVLSGLLSMNPWGLLEGGSAEPERARLRGPSSSGAQLKQALQAIAFAPSTDVVSFAFSPLDGRPFFVATTAQGKRQRFDGSGAYAPLNESDWSYVATTLNGRGPPISPSLMTQEDPYYFGHHAEAPPLPVYRMVLRDGSHTRYYIDPVSGMLVAKIDRAAQAYRWWHEGLHRMDFAAVLRVRPWWDALMLLLMSGVTFVCVTGVYLGFRRIARALRRPSWL